MLVSCKCLNFIATSSCQQRYHKSFNSTAAVPTADDVSSPLHPAPMSPAQSMDGDFNMPCNDNGTVAAYAGSGSLSISLMNAFLQKYQPKFPFYSQYMEFFKQAIGPVPDLAVNALNQRDLIYSITLEVEEPINNGLVNGHGCCALLRAWQISICINCNSVLCAKRLGGFSPTPETFNNGHNHPMLTMMPSSQQQYLINCSLLTNNDELMQRRTDKSFSEIFGLLIMDHPQLSPMMNGASIGGGSINNGGVGSVLGNGIIMTPSSAFGFMDLGKQQRLKQLQQHLQQRQQKEIADTDERIQRYTEQQFALLKNFRHKSEQEFELLVHLIQCVPDKCELLDRSPPALDVNGSAVGIGVRGYGQRRRNTIGSRRDLNVSAAVVAAVAASTPPPPPPPPPPLPPSSSSTATAPAPAFMPAALSVMSATTNKLLLTTLQQASATIANGNGSNIDIDTTAVNNISPKLQTQTHTHAHTMLLTTQTTTPTTSNLSNHQQQQEQQQQQQQLSSDNNNDGALCVNGVRKLSNFDTPPATPESASMSVGNSPTFRQQQQQTSTIIATTMNGANVSNYTTTANATATAAAAAATVDGGRGGGHAVDASGRRLNSSSSFQQQFPTPTAELADDCVFELEDVDDRGGNNSPSSLMNYDQPMPVAMNANHHHYDGDGSDSAEEAEDALDLDGSSPINTRKMRRSSLAINFAKSLPVQIATSPMVQRTTIPSPNEDILENVSVDIAASIKALAKSVHGEAVFGDLPRPRLRSQI